MANFLSGFLDNLGQGLTNPKGNLGDFAHAARLYNSNAFRLAPKVKFLYHVVFNINPQAIKSPTFDTKKHITAINMLVKAVDLPKFKIQVDTSQQYNRKKQVQTKIDYDNINITFHDDNTGLTTLLWQLYYGYYYADSRTPNAFQRNSYKGEAANVFRYGLDNNSSVPFFTSITIYQMSRHYYQSYMLMNPIITSWQHDNLDNSSSDTVQNTMQIGYEAVIYGSGKVQTDNPAGFATDYYDKQPSPLGVLGGGTISVFGVGGVAEGITSILDDIATGRIFTPSGFLGTLIKGSNTFNNTRQLSSQGLRQEGFNILTGAIQSTTGAAVAGVANIAFPKTGGNGQNQTTPTSRPVEVSKSSALTSTQQSVINNSTVALSSLTNLAINSGIVAPGSTAQTQVQNLLAGGKNIKLNGLASKVLSGL